VSPAFGDYRSSNDRSCACRSTLLNSDFVELSADPAPSVTFHHDETIHARDRRRNVHAHKQFTIGSLRQIIVDTESGDSN
jgi:hypothetical protein